MFRWALIDAMWTPGVWPVRCFERPCEMAGLRMFGYLQQVCLKTRDIASQNFSTSSRWWLHAVFIYAFQNFPTWRHFFNPLWCLDCLDDTLKTQHHQLHILLIGQLAILELNGIEKLSESFKNTTEWSNKTWFYTSQHYVTKAALDQSTWNGADLALFRSADSKTFSICSSSSGTSNFRITWRNGLGVPALGCME